MKDERNIFKLLRIVRGISRREIADKVNRPVEDIEAVESGDVQPEGSFLDDYAKALRVPTQFILHRIDEPMSKGSRFEECLYTVLNELRILDNKYKVQVKLPYTHSESGHREQFALYFTAESGDGEPLFCHLADTAEEAKSFINNAYYEGIPCKAASVRWNTSLQSRRCEKGFTGRQLAAASGVLKSTIDYLEGECGRVNRTPLDTAIRLAEALGCSVYDIRDTNGNSGDVCG